jgi:MoxR-like ATPase
MDASQAFERQLETFRADFEALRQEISRRVVGLEKAIQALLTALVAGGHVLIEGPPGTGKTLLVHSLADALDLTFQRVQCTVDLMPADIIGTYVVMETPQGRRVFEFHKGPIFANVVLADHLNRAPPKTQSALMQAMEGEAVNVATESFPLPRPYLVVATQDPLESEGTYPLPDAELDRFLFKIVAPPAGPNQIDAILRRTAGGDVAPPRRVVDAARVLAMGELVRGVAFSDDARRAVVAIVAATQPQSDLATPLVRRYVRSGGGPRGALALALAAKVQAALAGRCEVLVEDVLAWASPALVHRLALHYDAAVDDVSADAIVADVLRKFASQ